MRKTVLLRRDSEAKCWTARELHSGEPAVPLPFTVEADASTVMRAAKKVFPGAALQVGLLDFMPYRRPAVRS